MAITIFRPTTLNPSAKGATVTLSGGDLTAVFAALSAASVRSIASIPAGRYYFEAKIVASDAGGGLSGFRVGLCSGAMPLDTADPYASQVKVGVIAESDEVFFAGSPGGVTGAAFLVVGDVVGLHIDTDAHTVQVYVNGVASGGLHTHPAVVAGLYPFVGFNGSSSYALTASVNFGGGAFMASSLSDTTMGVVGLIPTTWNPSDKHSSVTLSNGNLTALSEGGSVRSAFRVSSGKYYFEYKFAGSTGQMMGVGSSEADLANWPGADSFAVALERASGSIYQGGGTIYYGTAGATTVGVLLDADAKTVRLRRNNANLGSPIALAGTKFFAIAGYFDRVIANFGATAFTYAVPAGYTAGFGEEPWKVVSASSVVALDGVRPIGSVIPTTWSLTDKHETTTVSGDTLTGGGGSGRSVFSATTGRWYWEITFAEGYSSQMSGVATGSAGLDTWPGADPFGWAYERPGANYTNGAFTILTPAPPSLTGVLGVALDLFNNTLRYYSDGVALSPTISLSRGSAPVFAVGGYIGPMSANFGATGFVHAIPNGYERGFGVLNGPYHLVAVSTRALEGATGSAEATVGGMMAAAFSGAATLEGSTGAGEFSAATSTAVFTSAVGLGGVAENAAASILCSAAASEQMAGISQAATFTAGTAPTVHEAASSIELAGAAGAGSFSVATPLPTKSFAGAATLSGVTSNAFAVTGIPVQSSVTLDGVTGTGTYGIARVGAQDVTLDGAAGEGAATVLTHAVQAQPLDGVFGDGAATLLTHAAQARTLAGVSGAGTAKISLSAAQDTQLAGITQTTKGGPVVQAQAQATLEGAAAEAAYRVITYARATAALEGADGAAAATVRVTGTVQTWLAGVVAEAEATVLVQAQAQQALDGAASIAALLRFGERQFLEDVSAVDAPNLAVARTAFAQAYAAAAAASVPSITRQLEVTARE